MIGRALLAAAALLIATPASAATHKIEYDAKSLIIDGKRVAVWGGEIHPFRLPSPDLWRDVLQKMKANGFNTVALYFDWGYHSPKKGVYDFTGIRDVERVLEMAEEEGLYVITRAGPYVNAELSRGGFPGWLVNQSARARTDNPEYLEAADEWLTRINKIIARHQLTDGKGSVILHQIENELDVVGPAQANYMRHLYDKARADGITGPIFHNDKGRNGYWVPKGSGVPGVVEGPTDLYAFDGYPGGVCSVQNKVQDSGTAPDWGLYGPGGAKGGATASPKTPGFLAEFGGGWFDYWGSNGMYPCNAEQRGKRYQRVFYGTNLANGITLQSFYMSFGGTSWGWLPGPVVYTSYDYGAAISETREVREKALELKQLGEFIAASPDLLEMEKAAPLKASNDDVQVYHNRNVKTDSRLIFVRHVPAKNNADSRFSIDVKLPDGAYRLPSTGTMRLNGFDAKLLVAGVDLGGQRLVYSTSELQTRITRDGEDVVLMYGRVGEAGETVLRFAKEPKVTVLAGGATKAWDAAKGDLRLNYAHDGLTRVRIEGGGRPPLLLLLADENTAQSFWKNDTAAGAVLARGPALVRTASLKGGALQLTGDTASASLLEVWAPAAVRSLSWNSAAVASVRGADGALAAKTALAGPVPVSLPDLGAARWRVSAASPAAAKDFDDSRWQTVDDRRFFATVRPPTGQPNMGMDAYGFHNGDVWYRGRFSGTAEATKLTVHYGAGGAGLLQVWLDGKFLGQHELAGGLPRPITTGVAEFPLPPEARSGEHVLSVMVRNNGHNWDLDADDFHKETRGIVSASLDGGSFNIPIAWKIEGLGEDEVDPVRGPANNGGLEGERRGWHLPGFPDSGWREAKVPAADAAAGTRWYRTNFDLDLPKGQDVTVGLSIGDPDRPRSPNARYRVLIFVNGWHMGQFIAHIGPQRTFVLPEGILNHRGRNSLALAVTSDGESGNALEAVKLVAMRNVRGGLPVRTVASPAYKQ